MPGFVLNLSDILKGKKNDERGRPDHPPEEGETEDALIQHHLEDAKKALMKCIKSLKTEDWSELVDGAVLLQSAAIDIEELVTGKEPEL